MCANNFSQSPLTPRKNSGYHGRKMSRSRKASAREVKTLHCTRQRFHFSERRLEHSSEISQASVVSTSCLDGCHYSDESLSNPKSFSVGTPRHHARSLPQHRPHSMRHTTVFYTTDGKIFRSTTSDELCGSQTSLSPSQISAFSAENNGVKFTAKYIRKIDNFGEIWDENDLEVQRLTGCQGQCSVNKDKKCETKTGSTSKDTDSVEHLEDHRSTELEDTENSNCSGVVITDFTGDATIEYKLPKE